MHWAISCSTRTTAAVTSPSGGCAQAASKRASTGPGGTSAAPSTSPAHPAASSAATANVAAAVQRRASVIDVPLAVSYTHLRAHETRHDLVCRLLLEKK